MSWEQGEHCPHTPDNINKEWENVKGDLTQAQAEEWFCKYLACTPNAAAELLIGPKMGRLHPIQDILIRTWFQRKKNVLIAGRGFSKSYTTAIFCVLYAIFNPGAKIGIFSASFRQAKLLFATIEKFIESSASGFLQQCITKDIKHATDAHEMRIGISEIKALPLTHKTRGMRFTLIIVDEYLSVPEKIIQEIIKPMLAVKKGDPVSQKQIRRGEDILVKEGKLKEWQRTKFLENKFLALSSASYKFETLYKDTYLDTLDTIHNAAMEDVDASLFRLSYKCAPPDLLDLKEIKDAERTYSKAQFEREYMAIFTDESGGFYNAKDIAAASLQFGEEPTVKLRGTPGKKYIISSDPTFSAGSEEADDFSMCVIELADDGSERGFLVHSYALAKSNVKKRTSYLEYLLNNFDVELIIMDNAGGTKFIEEFNALHPDFHKTLQVIDIDFDTEEGFLNTKHLYNKQSGAMCIMAKFQKRGFIREANENLQADIQHKRMMFGCPIMNDDTLIAYNMSLPLNVDLDELEFKYMDEQVRGQAKKMEFIEWVDQSVQDTKTQLANIQMTSDSVGNFRFDLPKEMKMNKGKNKARRDSYTALFIGNYGRRCYWRVMAGSQFSDGDFFTGTWL